MTSTDTSHASDAKRAAIDAAAQQPPNADKKMKKRSIGVGHVMPDLKSNVFAYYIFSWVDPLLKAGWKKPLETEGPSSSPSQKSRHTTVNADPPNIECAHNRPLGPE